VAFSRESLIRMPPWQVLYLYPLLPTWDPVTLLAPSHLTFLVVRIGLKTAAKTDLSLFVARTCKANLLEKKTAKLKIINPMVCNTSSLFKNSTESAVSMMAYGDELRERKKLTAVIKQAGVVLAVAKVGRQKPCTRRECNHQSSLTTSKAQINTRLSNP
jgi:hypothetical protein